ncbi:helix-turn-helix transcriptional regulator [[Eubacterium] tenue]|nr:helix-turn-helix transcriptional regulator [[Eubacterium] tenue]MBC8632097.1 helix-turn-helix transcriptional regulator [[Eubacterium] tenue]
MNFGEKLKSLRIKHELSQENLAEKLNVSRQAITKWESQNSMPDIENLKSIATIFDVTTDSLIYDEEEIETTEDSFCWQVACIFGGIGLVAVFLFEDIEPSLSVSGIGLAIIGYLVAKCFLIFKAKC